MASSSGQAGEGIKPTWQTFKPPGSYVMALARDCSGNVWVGTEGSGVWRYSGNEEGRVKNEETGWTQFTTTKGLGDDIGYALAVDKQGRVWVGHLNHGVSVFNGKEWRNYDVPNGPIGERIFKIAVCPTDGDVWMGTSAGLTRYSVSKDTWSHYTRNSGDRIQNPEEEEKTVDVTAANPELQTRNPKPAPSLPSDQISAITFDAKGNIYVGTQCDGVAMASREADYQDWRRAPVFTANGLPSRLINDLLAASNGNLYAATSGGLAWSRDGGATWLSRRGGDLPDKMKGLAGGVPRGWSAAMLPKNPLPEDYVTCLAEDEAGVIWLGFRQRGLLALSDSSYVEQERAMAQATGGADYVRAILSVADHRPWLASYGKGLLRASKPLRLQERELVRNATPVVAAVAAFPTPARAPDLRELNGLLQEIAAVTSATLTNGGVVALEDDWRTQGQWLGRYGRFWAVLCANWSPNDDVWGAGWGVQYDAQIGGNHAPGDSLRYWVHWLATKDNRCLEMTPTYLHSRVLERTTTWDVDRRESEWDDHGEEYPMTKDGPHLYCSLNIPAGLFYLSLYEVNPNGQEGGMRFRDYQISIRPHPGRASLDEQQPGKTVIRSFYDIAEFDQKPELAHARACDFWNGVYKRFLVRGPAKLTVQVNRNNSYNTILPAVMLDLVDELPPPYYQTRQEWEDQQTTTNTAAPSVFYAAITEATAARRLQAELGKMPAWNAVWWAENQRRFHLPLLRWHVQAAEKNASASGEDLATCYYRLGHFTEWEKKLKGQNVVPARDIEKALRWDGVTYSCAGKGNEIVAEYLRTHLARLNTTMPGKPD